MEREGRERSTGEKKGDRVSGTSFEFGRLFGIGRIGHLK